MPAAGRLPAAGARGLRLRAAGVSPGDACSAALGLAAVPLLAFNDGGYFSATWAWSALGFGAATGIVLLARGWPRLAPLCWLSLGALAALAVWMLASALWGAPGTEAVREASRAVMYVAGFAAFLIVVSRDSTKAFLGGVLGGIVAIEAYALTQRAVAPRPPDPFQGTLLVGPLGYANALGILAAVGVLLASGLLWTERRPLAKAFLCAAAVVSSVALTLTSSRGALGSLVLGLVVLFVLRRRARVRRSLPALLILAVVAVGASIAIRPHFFGDRPAYWRVALADAAQHPVLGSGAGSFDDVWLTDRPIAANVRDAHSLYLEALAELGPVGLLLLLAALTFPLAAIRRARGASVVPAAAAGYCAFLAHAGLDWDWEMPATTLAGLACGAALLASARPATPL